MRNENIEARGDGREGKGSPGIDMGDDWEPRMGDESASTQTWLGLFSFG